MIVTENTKVIEVLESLLSKDSYITVDRHDVDKMFPDKSSLCLINVAGDDVETLAKAFNDDYSTLSEEPKAAVAFILSQNITMNQLAALNDALPASGSFKRAILFEKSDAGAIELYYFFQDIIATI